MIYQIAFLFSVVSMVIADGFLGHYAAAKPYSFGYAIKDHHGENHRHESGVGGQHVQGSYGFTDNRGIHRQVDYVADHGGFKASVKTNEPGTANQDPAAVKILSSAHPYFGAGQGIHGGWAGHAGAYGGHAGAYGGQSGAFGGHAGAYGGHAGAYGGHAGAYGGYPGTYGGHAGAYGGYAGAYEGLEGPLGGHAGLGGHGRGLVGELRHGYGDHYGHGAYGQAGHGL